MSKLPSFLMASDTEPGFVDERCPHCRFNMYDDKQGVVLCLNGCHLPVYLERLWQEPSALDMHFAGAETSEGKE